MRLQIRREIRDKRCAVVSEALEPRRFLAATLLADVNTSPVSAAPEAFVEYNGSLYLSATGPHGRELYRSDGTQAGTALLKDIEAGPGGSSPRDFTVAGGLLYFTAATANGTSRNLWRTDGTAAGTIQLTGLQPAGFAANPTLLTATGDRVYFAAADAVAGQALMVTDGTPEGTAVAFDPPGDGDALVTAIEPRADITGRVFFATYRGVTGQGAKLWETAGTPGNASLLDTFGFERIDDWAFKAFGAGIVFAAEDFAAPGAPRTGSEPFFHVAGSTFFLKDIYPGEVGSSIDGFVNVNGTLYFRAFQSTNNGYRLWKTDGTPAGTTPAAPFNATSLAAFNGSLFSLGFGELGNAGGIYRTNASGTFLFKELPNAHEMIVSGGQFYVTSTAPHALTRIDPATREAVPLGTFTAVPTKLTPFRNGVAFAASDAAGNQPWVSDGTAAGTVRIGPIHPETTLGSWPSFTTTASVPVRVGGRTLFAATGGGALGLWATDLTTAGTTRLAPLAGHRVLGLRAARRPDGSEFAYVLSLSGTAAGALWTTDGTDAGTTLVRNLTLPEGVFVLPSLAVMNGEVYFSGDLPEDPRGMEPLKSDGTAAGTVRLKDLYNPAPGVGSDPGDFTPVGGSIFFTARNISQSGNELWRTDGTAAGTVLVKSFVNIGGLAGVEQRTLVAGPDGALLFRTRDSALWRSDGTPQGTTLVRSFASPVGVPPSDPSMARMGNAVYFSAEHMARAELWKTDGTTAGTVLVKDIVPGFGDPASLTTVGDRVFFVATDPAGGRELWATDGTEAGTARVIDIVPGTGTSSPRILGVAPGRVLFSADDRVRGAELWSSDGTAEGTAPVEDVRPGAAGSNPVYATGVGGRVLFWADDGTHGTEPWLTPPPQPRVVARHVFYNDSAFDGRNENPNPADDGAVAPDKHPLLPGELATFSNITTYTRGINGIMIDVAHLPPTALAGIAGSVELKTGAGGDSSKWADAPRPIQIGIRPGAGAGGSDRVTLVWDDGAIRNAWLRVTVSAPAQYGLDADTFTFGNLVGEIGEPALTPAAWTVTAADANSTRAASSRRAAPIDAPADHNRDGVVNVLDYAAARRNVGVSVSRPFTPPTPPSAMLATPSARRTILARRSVLADDAAPGAQQGAA